MEKGFRFENDFVIRESEKRFGLSETITFKNSEGRQFVKHDYDWYITVAMEKADKVKVDRHLLTADLLIGYRNAIREGYQHSLDQSLQKPYDYPRNRNTIAGIQSYIKKINQLSKS